VLVTRVATEGVSRAAASASVGGVVGEGAAELGLEVVDHGSARPSVVGEGEGEGEAGEGGRGTRWIVPPAAPAHIGRTERIGRRDPLVASPDPLPVGERAAGARDALRDGARAAEGTAGRLLGVEGDDREHGFGLSDPGWLVLEVWWLVLGGLC
jgi:hypothetical protein